MTSSISAALDNARMTWELNEQAIRDAIDDSGRSAWLRSALAAMLARDPAAAAADAGVLFRLMAERVAAARALAAIADQAR